MNDNDPTDGPRIRSLDRSRPIHVSLPTALYDRLTDTAARLGISRSLLAREAVAAGFKHAADKLRAKARRNSDASGDTTEADA